MSTCDCCGSRCRGRYCRYCGPIERNDHLHEGDPLTHDDEEENGDE